MSIALGTRLHINIYIYIYIYKTTSVSMLVLLSQNAQSDEKVILSRCTMKRGPHKPQRRRIHVTSVTT